MTFMVFATASAAAALHIAAVQLLVLSKMLS